MTVVVREMSLVVVLVYTMKRLRWGLLGWWAWDKVQRLDGEDIVDWIIIVVGWGISWDLLAVAVEARWV
jgi:hypothetical protein